MIRGKEEIKTLDDVIKCMSNIMEEYDGAWQFNHEYHQVLQIHREVGGLEKRLDRLENKIDMILNRVCLPEDLKKLEQVQQTMNEITESMKGMRTEWDKQDVKVSKQN
jgi:flagellin-specific chaperone FliS